MKIKDKKIVSLKRRLKKEEIKGLALDIDDTLSSTLGIVIEKMVKKLGNPENLSVEEIVKKYRHTHNIPYWQTSEAEEILHSVTLVDKEQRNLPLIENSNEVVQGINKIIPIVAYVTARPLRVINGTKYWLKKNDFPKATVIVKTKGATKRNANKWKARVLEYLYPEVVGIVDDNDGLQKFFSRKYKGIIFLYGGKKKRDDINVIECENWESVANKVKECKI